MEEKEVKNEDKKEQSTEQNVKDSTKESKESVVKGMNQAPTSLVGNEKPNVVFAYMLQNQINGDSLDKENIKVLKSLYDIRDNAQNTHIKIMEKIKDFTDDSDSFVTPQDFSAINKQLDELLSAS